VQLPGILEAAGGGSSRTLVACFATWQSLLRSANRTGENILTGGGISRDYVQLSDGLEIIPAPRFGSFASPAHPRALPLSSPSFALSHLKQGDLLFFKPILAGDTTDCTLGSHDAFGAISPSIPNVSSSNETALLANHTFAMDGTGRVSLPGTLSTTDLGFGVAGPTRLAACLIPAGAMVSLQAGYLCPVDDPHVAVGGGSNPDGAVCERYHDPLTNAYRPLLVNGVRLPDELTVFAEPIDALVDSWYEGHVYEMRFTQPQFGVVGTKTFAAGMAGDVVVLQRDGGCSGAHLIQGAANTSSYVHGHSARMVLEEHSPDTNSTDDDGGSAKVRSLAEGKVNELLPEVYSICYATLESGAEEQGDFVELSMTLEILPTPAIQPQLGVASTVTLGTDIVVEWEANSDLSGRIESGDSWIGLYHRGSCMGSHGKHGNEWSEPEGQTLHQQLENTQASGLSHGYVESNQHECYLAAQFVTAGVQGGAVRFSQQDYRSAGQYDVRFFQGDSRNQQGRVCRGLSGVAHETYVDCVLEAAAVSDTIEVFADPHMTHSIENIPGMEVMFGDERARFEKIGPKR